MTKKYRIKQGHYGAWLVIGPFSIILSRHSTELEAEVAVQRYIVEDRNVRK